MPKPQCGNFAMICRGVTVSCLKPLVMRDSSRLECYIISSGGLGLSHGANWTMDIRGKNTRQAR